MLNLVRLEMLLNRRGWVISFLLVVGFMVMMASLANIYLQNTELVAILENFPPGIMQAFGISVESFMSFTGFISSQPYTFFILLLGASTGIWSSSSISKERDQQTGEFLFTLAYSRSLIFFSKATAHFIQVTFIYLASFAAIAVVGTFASDLNEYGPLLSLWTAGYVTCLAFAGIGYIVTSFISSERSAISIGVGLVIVSFLLNMFAGMDESVRWIANFSLFSVFNAKSVLDGSALRFSGVLITLGIYALGLIIGTAVFKQKDMV